MKTVDFLDAIRARYNNCSDYRAAQLLRVRQNTTSSYRTGRSFFDDDVAIRAAALLDLPAEYVISCVHAERAKTEEVRKVWDRVAKLTRRAAAAVAVVTGLGTVSPPPAAASPAQPHNLTAVYYVK